MNFDKLKGVEIVLVSTVPFFLVNQLARHIRNLKEKGMRITLVTSAGDELEEFMDDELIRVVTVDIARKIDLWKDLKVLFFLVKLFARQNYTIMHSTTPKAGLLCAIASKLTRVPIRLHTFTGQVWLTKTGLMKGILQYLDKVIVLLDTHCYTDSLSQRDLLIDSGIAEIKSISTYGEGSLAGVDLERFSQLKYSVEFKKELKQSIGFKNDTFVLTFIGRLTRDKGIYELLASFEQLQSKHSNIGLIILGPMEEVENTILENKISSLSDVYWGGNVSEPEKFLSITDVLCLPSYREGFGTVVIEAAAMGVPTVGCEVSGLVDAVEQGVTGLLVPPRNINAYTEAVDKLICDKSLLQTMKCAAKIRCERYFDSHKVNEYVVVEYLRWLSNLH